MQLIYIAGSKFISLTQTTELQTQTPTDSEMPNRHSKLNIFKTELLTLPPKCALPTVFCGSAKGNLILPVAQTRNLAAILNFSLSFPIRKSHWLSLRYIQCCPLFTPSATTLLTQANWGFPTSIIFSFKQHCLSPNRPPVSPFAAYNLFSTEQPQWW